MLNGRTGRKVRLLAAGLLAAALATTLAAARDVDPQYSRVARRIARVLPREHLTRQSFDDIVASRAFTNYLAALDYDRVYFLQADIDRFAGRRSQLDDQLKAGDVGFALDVFEVFRARVHDRVTYVRKLLAAGFNLDTVETYAWKRKQAPWPRDEAEWNELWRTRVKNEFVRRTIARERRMAETNAPPTAAAPTAPTNAIPAAPGQDEDDISIPGLLESYEQFQMIMDDTDDEWLLQRYFSAFTQAYDPHSEYFSPASEEDFDIEMKLSLVGVGALLESEDGAARIVSVIPGGPADRDKSPTRLLPGDKIIAVGQGAAEPVHILHWPLHKVVRLVRGEKGTRVTLIVIPATDKTGLTTKRVELVRDEVKLEEQAAQSKVREALDGAGVAHKLGVVTVPAFYANLGIDNPADPAFRSSARDVETLLLGLATQSVHGVLLDLRNNGGGSLPEAVTMTGLFIKDGPVVQVEESLSIESLPDRDARIVYGGPLVVLVSRLSASASEILAAALQDYGRAIIVGDTQTHGKGTVQSVEPLGFDADLGSLKMTKWMFYRVTGSSTQVKGVVSDLVVPSPFDYMDFGEEHLDHALPWKRVAPADYRPLADLSHAIPLLRNRSEARCAADPRFLAYRNVLSRVEAMNRSPTLPLDLTTRREIARAEDELANLQKELERNGAAGTPDKPNDHDLVLEEALRILADLAALGASAAPPPATAGTPASTNVAAELAPPPVAPPGATAADTLRLVLRVALAMLALGLLLAWIRRRET